MTPPTLTTCPAPLSAGLSSHERQAWLVAGLSVLVMLAETVGGSLLNSVGLISDGIHTLTHVAVMVTAGVAYAFARRRRKDVRFAFGAGKALDLAAFASGVGLAVAAFFIALEAIERLIKPEPVAFAEAAGVAGLGLLVGVLSATLLHSANAPRASHSSEPPRRDLNLWAAYLHMLADVVTSILTIVALAFGAVLHWMWLDPAVGLLNAAVVATFAVRLLRQASAVLLDMAPPDTIAEIKRRLESDQSGPVDVRLWAIGDGQIALLARVDGDPRPILNRYRAVLSDMPQLKHLMAEVDSAI